MIPSYPFFQAKLYPVLPLLIYQAAKVKRARLSPPAISEKAIFGYGEKKILLIGESTAAGVGASLLEFTLAGQLFQHLGPAYQVLNLGKNGLRVAQVINHFGGDLPLSKESHEGIFLFLGANDCFRLTHPRHFYFHLDNLISELKSRYFPKWIYLADIPPVHLFPAFPALLRSYLRSQRSFLQKEMEKLCVEEDLLIFDRLELSLSPQFFASDGIHPSNLGYEKIAAAAIQGIKDRMNR